MNTKNKVKGLGCLRSILIGVPIFIILIIFGLYGWFSYNSMVKAQQEIHMTWADVENSYQKRLELIPNIVNTVKGYAEHEQTTLTQVTQARSNASGIDVNPQDMSEAEIAKFEAAQQNLTTSLDRLMVVVEQYPNLKANQNFIQLQNELKLIEQEIIVRRDKFNQAVKKYNVRILRFPRNIFAKLFGFNEYEYFKSVNEAKEAPKVVF